MSSFSKTIGFIGSGNMATAIIRGMISTGIVKPHSVWVSDANPAQIDKVVSQTSVQAAVGNVDLVQKADVVVLATKPYHVTDVMSEVKAVLEPGRHVLISICAGITTRTIEEAAGGDLPVIRVMPNTPALIGSGSAGIAGGRFASDSHLSLASQVFDSVGSSVVLPEEKLDAVTGVSGSGPAYVFRFIEALIAAGEDSGLTTDEARALVPQMVLGAARMAVEGDRSLSELREAVTTPGGTTAAGLKVLEEGDFMALISDCVAAATARSKELAKG